MLKIINVDENFSFLFDIGNILQNSGGLIFSENENPLEVFFNDLLDEKKRVLVAMEKDKVLAFLVLYNFKNISKNMFTCYMYGGAKRGIARDLDMAFATVFAGLKSQGCVAIRFETREYNLPMRFCARRLGFKKTGILSKASFVNGNFIKHILYEKLL